MLLKHQLVTNDRSVTGDTEYTHCRQLVPEATGLTNTQALEMEATGWLVEYANTGIYRSTNIQVLLCRVRQIDFVGLTSNSIK